MITRAVVVALLATACTPGTSAPPVVSVTTPPVSSPSSTPSEPAHTNGYSPGYGTYYVATRRTVPSNWGDAKTWYAHAQAAGFAVGATPKVGAIACTSSGAHGQVAIVEEVSADNTHVVISEMNGAGGWNKVTTRTAPASAFTYIY